MKITATYSQATPDTFKIDPKMKFKIVNFGKEKETPWGIQYQILCMPINKEDWNKFLSNDKNPYRFPYFYVFSKDFYNEYKIGDIGLITMEISSSAITPRKHYKFNKIELFI